jgi:ribose transport system ATP-binding protein
VAGKNTGDGRPSDGPLLLARGVTKTYGPTAALQGVDLEVRQGEVLALLGANGAGKSTLLNVIGGTVRPDGAQLVIAGQEVNLAAYGALEARAAGIQRVFQELSVFANLSVAANFSLTGGKGTALRRHQALREAESKLETVFPGNSISPRAEVGTLGLAGQQMVEIARAATERGTRLLILDEPTSALGADGAAQLSDYLRRATGEGLAVIYVTHKLDEALALADRIVVLRDGKVHWEGQGRTATRSLILEKLGAAESQAETGSPATSSTEDKPNREILTVGAASGKNLNRASLTVRAGEIVGLAGLEGAGQRELLQHVFSHRSKRTGGTRVLADVAYVSGDRKNEGILPLWSVLDNVGVSSLRKVSTAGFIKLKAHAAVAGQWLARLGLTNRAEDGITELSGGNQQRTLLARALATGAPLLLLDDPTRGVDVTAKRDIYETLDMVRDDGRSALFYSTENAEFAHCDRVLVMASGTVVAELPGSEATEERIVQASYISPDSADNDRSPSGLAKAWHQTSHRLTWALGSGPGPAALLFIGMIAAVIAVRPGAANPVAANMLLQSSTVMAVAALAQMMFILGGDFDLGLGFAIGFVNVVGATLLSASPWLGLLALMGVVAGYVAMAFLVERVGVPSVVATLGASFVWLGLGMLIQPVPGGDAPGWLVDLTRIKLAPVPENAFILLGLALLGWWVISRWRYATTLKALGANRKTLVDLGYSPLRSRIVLYTVAAGFVILAGLLVTGQTTSSDVNASSPLTLGAVAAVIVGGASFSGGRVSPVGAVLAAVALSLISSLLVFIGVDSQYSTATGGLVLILVLALRAAVGKARP